MLNVAVFGSGQGSNFFAILTAIQRGSLPGARICLVLSNNSQSGILSIARANALPAIHLSQKQFPDEAAFADTMLSTLRIHGADFIALAGYMKRVPPRVVTAFQNRIINIHPALLPRHGGPGMYGLHVHEAVLAAGEKQSGATVHMVDELYDHGAIILQKAVPVLPGDTPETLAARVLLVEHEIYPEAIRLIAANAHGGRTS
ncbi:MAG TPA: phosphoribosylglycinamide formyltransferase [Bacteroidota bacterium]|nr:phosphoribosylglycinamide formyltransferase [Bacteroidota bacterium]